MIRFVALLVLPVVLGACTITTEGARVSPPPPAVQGSDDVQGAPLSVPGSGMGVGSGNPEGGGGIGPTR